MTMRTPRGSRPVTADRGATAALFGIMAFVMVLSAAFAVDLTVATSRSRSFQSAADVAALTAARTLHETGSPAAARSAARESVRASGMTSPRVRVIATMVDAATVRVEVIDPAMPLVFGRLVAQTMRIERSATATMTGCATACMLDLTIDPPSEIGRTADGSGDGYVPVVHGTRVYAMNHHAGATDRLLVCVDYASNDLSCPGYPVSVGSYTNDISVPVVVDARDELWYSHQTDDWWGLGCWSLRAHRSCGTVRLADLERGRADHERDTRGSNPILHGGRIFAMSDTFTMFCIDPATQTMCGGYPRQTGLAASAASGTIATDAFEANGGRTWSIDHEVHDGRAYMTHMDRPSDAAYLHCFDLHAGAPCSSFASAISMYPVGSGDGAWEEPYVYLRPDGSGRVEAVCVHDVRDEVCVRPDGSPTTSSVGLQGRLATGRVRTELAVGTRSYFPIQDYSEVECWDWAAARSCGNRAFGGASDPLSAGRRTEDYGYARMGDCIIGLGHTGYFYSFGLDLGPCRSATRVVAVPNCTCLDGTIRLGTLSIADPTALTELTSLVVELIGPDGTVLRHVDLVAEGGSIDLASLVAAGEVVADLRVSATWQAGIADRSPIEVEYDSSTRPTLIE